MPVWLVYSLQGGTSGAGLKQPFCCVQSGWGYAAASTGGAGYTGGLDGLGLDEEESGSEQSEDSEESEEE